MKQKTDTDQEGLAYSNGSIAHTLSSILYKLVNC